MSKKRNYEEFSEFTGSALKRIARVTHSAIQMFEKLDTEYKMGKKRKEIIEKWFARAYKLIQKSDNISDLVYDDFHEALNTTVAFSKWWYDNNITLKFGEEIPCDCRRCWYLDHPARVSEFNGILRRSLLPSEISVCCVCYELENYTDMPEWKDEFDSENYVADFIDYMNLGNE